MTDAERYIKRREYYREYAKRKKAQRAEASRRWREKNRARYNAMQREYMRGYRQSASTTLNKSTTTTTKTPKVKAVTTQAARRLELLRNRFAALKPREKND